MNFISALIPSTEKCMLDSRPKTLPHLPKEHIMLTGERFAFQLVLRGTEGEGWIKENARLEISGIDMQYVNVKRVRYIPSLMPAYREPSRDDDYISHMPGFFPDLLTEQNDLLRLPVVYGQSHAYRIEISGAPEGEYDVSVSVTVREMKREHSLKLRVIQSKLPEQELILTQWFHCDCLASYYDCEVFSERHWRIIENFAKCAFDNGINMLLTPVLTPPLDTYVGGERPTCQLVDVSIDAGEYSFGFDKLDRWCDMANRIGFKYYEISHFFTQWGAAHAPKVMARADGEYKRIFGWESDASEGEYPKFLRAFVSALIDHMKKRGEDKKCFFHISDEPSHDNLEQYMKSKNVVSDLLADYPVMDALSAYEFYADGIVELPIPSSNHIKPFIDNNVQNLWTYYCCGQNKNVSNRFFAMNGARTRSIAAAFYKYNIVGFLQWGYNFYYNCHSRDFCNPYLDSTGDFWVPSGDTYSVYPSHDGRALESVRICHFREALEDLRAMKLLESLSDRKTVMAILTETFGEISFDISDYTSDAILNMREKINKKIAELSAN